MGESEEHDIFPLNDPPSNFVALHSRRAPCWATSRGGGRLPEFKFFWVSWTQIEEEEEAMNGQKEFHVILLFCGYNIN